MKTVRRHAHVAALSGIILLAGSAPALADSSSSSTSVSAQATAAVSKAQRLSKLKTLTKNSAASQNSWFTALGQYRNHKPAITKYRFDWSTDYCSGSPNSLPGGYDLKFPCYRHDFGYRNYKKIAGHAAFRRDHKLRIDKALLGDLNRVCGKRFWADPYTPAQRKKLKKACYRSAKKYYNAVRALG
ncbi:phospholipase A2 [Streptomyces sp. NPDC093094]|uniref:phospholipase A2 n=1 Tax=Streptomyces sp. NPDC093094 TaxID=3366026 RepID=UPI0037F5B73A